MSSTHNTIVTLEPNRHLWWAFSAPSSFLHSHKTYVRAANQTTHSFSAPDKKIKT